MQILALGVFARDGQRRDVHFQLGKLNILTGKSKTGKSAVLDIVEYCMGRDTVTIPTGVISDNASWYYLLLETGPGRVLICRPNPETASTNQAMVRVGGPELVAPTFAELEVNADIDVVRAMLSERVGVEPFRVEPDAGSLRSSFDVSIRQALFYCFQSQGEIANRDLLFHRQSEGDIRTAIRETLPYFLGSATPEQAALRRQLVTTRRALQKTLLAIQAAEAEQEQLGDRLTHLIASAIDVGVLPEGVNPATSGDVRTVLESIVQYSVEPGRQAEPEPESRRALLSEQGSGLRAQLRQLDERLEILERLAREEVQADGEATIQADRLSALHHLLPRNLTTVSGESTCPLCAQELAEPDETLDGLRTSLSRLESYLERSAGVATRRSSALEQLRQERLPIVQALRETNVQLDALARDELAVAAGQDLRERIAFLRGRASQELDVLGQDVGDSPRGGLIEVKTPDAVGGV